MLTLILRPHKNRLDQCLHDYTEAAGIADDIDVYLFRTARRKTGQLATNPLFQQDAHRIIGRRAKAAGIETRIGNHTFRATGITAYLKNSGKLEVAQQIANHESPRTTKLYDRRQDEISLDEIERIIVAKLAQRSLALAMLPGITRRWSLLAFPMPSAAAGISVNAHAAEHANCRS